MLRQEGRRRVMSKENIMNMRDFLCILTVKMDMKSDNSG